MKRPATALLVIFLTVSGCRSEDWIIVDKRGLGSTNFWGRVVNFDGHHVISLDNYPLNPAGRTQINISTALPVFEVRDVTVTAWADSDGTRDCSDPACRPLEGDPVVTLSKRNWPFVYEIVFQ